MSKHWFHRFKEAVAVDGRSLREISLAAGCGPNYLQQVVRDDKEPGSDRLARILDVLGGPTALYVLTGVHATEQDLEFLRLVQRMPEHVKVQTLALFESLQRSEEP